ncbi:uncharacterized protein LOC109861116 isoform X2 [Pseudomyrmex gracilis]|uniref:uncharacterized protein LOC109861116 isoform X2 n=1 Tax=Pseudomyrmex gracilis TaxID=219809 RepID=UPI000995761E|nr:uncharacterized protein LOC109861116 isoform X2 [Pseudomyrmex gracilis]
MIDQYLYRNNCQNEDIGWEKVIGAKPANAVESVLYKNSAIGNNGITIPCFDRCKSLNCTAFVIDFAKNICYTVQIISEELIPESNATFFHKICIKGLFTCKQHRLWQVERTLGAVLKDGYSNLYNQMVLRRSECYEKCLLAKNECKSAQFRTSNPLSSDDAIGTCLLSKFERSVKPQAYRSSMYRDEYLQDQCHNMSKKNYCSYTEFRNMTLPYSDIALLGLDIKHCEERCDSNQDGFICRAYTIDYLENKPLCLLHSDNTIGLGVSSLIVKPNVTYKEQEACLDLKVQCSESVLTITLITMEPFVGRIYVSGYEETCGVDGVRKNVTILKIPLSRRGKYDMECGLISAFSFDNKNRTHTLVWTTIVIQYNPIIQRLGDQSVKVGCSLEDRNLPEPKNISVHSSYGFLDPNAGVPPVASTILNASSKAPIVTMRILNEEHMDAVVTQLGQKLTLRIEIQPVDVGLLLSGQKKKLLSDVSSDSFPERL